MIQGIKSVLILSTSQFDISGNISALKHYFKETDTNEKTGNTLKYVPVLFDMIII